MKIMHPWPEEVLVPLAARAARPATVKWTEDRREHFISSAHERGQLHHVEVGFDDDGRLLGLDVQFWHDNGAYTPYGLIVPIITSTQLLGPYKPGAYRVEFELALHQHRDRHALPRRRPAAGLLRDGADDGRDRRGTSAWTAPRSARANFIQPDEFPYDHGLIFQDGRPLIYDSGDYPALAGEAQGAGRLGRVRGVPGRGRAREGRRVGIGLGLLRRGHRRRARTRARTCRSRPPGKVKVATGLTTQGQGHQTVFAQIVADELGVPLDDVDGHHRRHPPVRRTPSARSPPAPR